MWTFGIQTQDLRIIQKVLLPTKPFLEAPAFVFVSKASLEENPSCWFPHCQSTWHRQVLSAESMCSQQNQKYLLSGPLRKSLLIPELGHLQCGVYMSTDCSGKPKTNLSLFTSGVGLWHHLSQTGFLTSKIRRRLISQSYCDSFLRQSFAV